MSSLSGQELASGSGAADPWLTGDRFVGSPNETLATRAARGGIINAAFLAAINALGLVKGLVAASFLGASAYGIWGLVGVSTSLILALGAVGVDDKYIQQDNEDQETAFQVAFTMQCGLVLLLGVAIVAGVPLFARLYSRPEIIAPGIALALAMPAAALSTPLWVFWRRMDFGRQRTLQIWDPVVSLIVVVTLAIAGFGVWSLVVGTIVGSYAAAAAAMRASPYRLRLRYERGALREYASFSWPLLVGSASAVLISLIPALVASRELGLAAVGAITLSATIVQFAYRVDEVLTQVIYPAICSVRDQTHLLFAAFSKSNRLALLWALPFGAGGALFADDFVHYVLGEKWRLAVHLIQVLALTAAVNQIGFNWTAFYRALDRTRPIAVANVALLAGVIGIAVPLMLSDGLDGYAAGMASATAVFIGVRLYFLARIFPILRLLADLARAFIPAALSAGVIVVLRVVWSTRSSVPRTVGELGVFLVVLLVVTVVVERSLLREMLSYLRGRAPAETLLS
jgi:O-antigen/teichoic acid export membrane protein